MASALSAEERYPGFYSVVGAISSVLEDMVSTGDKKPIHIQRKGKYFSGVSPAPILIADYLRHLCDNSGASNNAFVLMLIYLDRFIITSGIPLTSYSAHRLVLTALVIATKYFDDIHFCNSFYAKLGGLPLQDLNAMELNFLNLLNFSCFVRPEEYESVYNFLRQRSLSEKIASRLTIPRDLTDIEPSIRERPEFDQWKIAKPIKIRKVPFVSPFTQQQIAYQMQQQQRVHYQPAPTQIVASQESEPAYGQYYQSAYQTTNSLFTSADVA